MSEADLPVNPTMPMEYDDEFPALSPSARTKRGGSAVRDGKSGLTPPSKVRASVIPLQPNGLMCQEPTACWLGRLIHPTIHRESTRQTNINGTLTYSSRSKQMEKVGRKNFLPKKNGNDPDARQIIERSRQVFHAVM